MVGSYPTEGVDVSPRSAVFVFCVGGEALAVCTARCPTNFVRTRCIREGNGSSWATLACGVVQ